MTWKMPGSLSDCMEPSSSNLPTELCWTVIGPQSLLGCPVMRFWSRERPHLHQNSNFRQVESPVSRVGPGTQETFSKYLWN